MLSNISILFSFVSLFNQFRLNFGSYLAQLIYFRQRVVNMTLAEIKAYNQGRKIRSYTRFAQGRYTRSDVNENMINGLIDLTVKSEKDREIAKMIVSLLS